MEGQKKSRFSIDLCSVILLIARLLLFLVVFILAIVTLAIFAAKNYEIKYGPHILNHCILFRTSSAGYDASYNSICNYVITGEVVVVFGLIVTAVYIVLKFFIVTKNIIRNIVSVVLCHVVTLIFSLSVAIVLTVGLTVTCETVESIVGTCDVPINDPSQAEAVYFLSSLQAAVDCSWVQCILLFPLIAFDIIYLILRKTITQTSTNYDKL